MSGIGDRRTARVNAGRHPARYGDPVTEKTRSKKDLHVTLPEEIDVGAEGLKTSDRHSASETKSSRTVKSMSSQLRDIDDKTEEAIDELDEAHLKQITEFKLMKVQQEMLEAEMAQLHTNNDTETDDDIKAENAKLLSEKKTELRELRNDIARAIVTLEADSHTLERRKRALRREGEAQKRDLEDSDDGDFRSTVDKRDEVAKWAENVQPFSPHEKPLAIQYGTSCAQTPNFQTTALAAHSTKMGDLISPEWTNPTSTQFTFPPFNWTTATTAPTTSTPLDTNCAPFSATIPITPVIDPTPKVSTTAAAQNPPIPRTSRSAATQFQTASFQPAHPTAIEPQNPPLWNIPATYPQMPTAHHSSSSNTDRILARQVQGRDLPSFSGRPEEWPAFYNAYNNSTQFCQFSNAENLIRLQKCLKGEAQKLIQCLLLTPQSVPRVLEKLKMRFGRPQQIIGSMLARVKGVPPVRQDKLESIIEFGIAVDNLTSTIMSLNCPEHLNNPMLTEELVKKLPVPRQIEWGTHLRTLNLRVPSLDVFAEWLNVQTEVACSLSDPMKPEEPKWERKRRGDDRVMVAEEKKRNQRRSNFSNGNQNQSRQSTCLCCDRSGHKIAECYKFKKQTNDERWSTVRSKRLCFCCFSPAHGLKDCNSKKECGTDSCAKMHHQMLHKIVASQSQPLNNVAANTNDQINFAREAPFINLLVIPVKLEGPRGIIETHVMLDNGSTLSVIEESLAEKLGLEGEKTVLRVAGFQSEPASMQSQIVSLTVKSKSEDFSTSLKNVKTVKNLNLRSQSVKRSLLKKWKHLQGINLDTYENKKPGILIGSDNPQLLLQLENRVGNGNAPVAVKTPLGWTLMGNTAWSSREQYAYHIHEEMEDGLHQLVKSYFTTESFGVMPLLEKPRSKDDKRAQSILDSTIRRVEAGWECGLLWRDEEVKLPESRAMAMRRLQSMERKMDRDGSFAQQYQEKIEEYLQKGFARELSPEEAAVETNSTYYLPHFMAFNAKKPGKLRFVFDAAAKSYGQSLNDHLLQGPDKLVSLPGVLLKFRQRKIGFTADIQDMFHRVKIKPEDAQAQRFLWRGMARDSPPKVYQMEVLIFGATCSPTCAQEVKNRNAIELQQEFPEAYDAIVTRHYVDDYLDSCDEIQEGIRRFEETRHVQLRGGFNLCNWLSSSSELMSHIPESLRAKSMKNLDVEEEAVVERVLGLFWRPEEDHFTFSLNFLKVGQEILSGKRIPTKREILSLVMSIYDPLGFLAVLTVKAKIILQMTWTSKIGWDDQIPSLLVEHWSKWLEHLKSIEEFRLPRCYSPSFSSAENNQLHVFCDASQEAFGAVAYLRIQKEEEIDVGLVMGKSKVAPLRPLSIPRLELQAAVLGARLAKFIREEMEVPIHRVVFWSDSTTVIRWLRSDSRFQTFVAQRIGELHELTNVEQWKWIPTENNVADELTRLHGHLDIGQNSRWVKGPNFLKLEEDKWPKETWNKQPEAPEDPEVKQAVFHVQEISPIFEFSRYSSWTKAVRTLAYVLRVAAIARKIKSNQTTLETEELEKAHFLLCKISQRESFPDDYASLSSGNQLPKNSRLRKLSPYLDDNNVIRLRGRLDNARELPNQVKRPVVLDPQHPYTRLYVAHFHLLCGHHGQERIVNEIRQLAYIFHLRTAVKFAQTQCQICSNRTAIPRPPEMGQLPAYRLQGNVFPFHHTGVDYFGPIEVIVKRSREKRYGALFTCLSTRAIHLEIAHGLTTDSCILAIRRFVGRRGSPAHLYSDNGTNFHGAANELRESIQELDQELIGTTCATKGMKWHFNPPAAPHMGGSWERMVRSVKVALGSVLKMKNLHDEVLETLMIEAEHTVNSHPLTHVPIDPDDEEALTPNHFLIGRSSNMQPIGQFDDADLFSKKQYRIVQHLSNHFWKRWIREFLPTLLRREKWCEPRKPIQVGDVVIEVNEALERNKWPKGIVTNIYPGRDGVIRVVEVKTGTGSIYKRPVAKLCILDVRRNSDSEESVIDRLPSEK